jgi:hypothetical protein
MQPDLLGYALNALDARGQAEVEAYLRDHLEAQAQLTALRQALEPLSWDTCAAAPPRLAEVTLEHIEKSVAISCYGNRKVFPFSSRRFAEVAAMLLAVVTAAGAGISWLGGLHGQRGGQPNPTLVTACKENLHKVFVALGAYGDLHNRQFPDVASAVEPPRNSGSLVFSILHDQQLLPADFKLSCPGTAVAAPAVVGLGDVRAMNELAYQGWAQSMQHGYAYSVGYHEGGQVVGPRLEDGKPNSQMPLVADNSPPDPLQGHQSLNHGGCGQNVLYSDGHVVFCPSRFVGYNLDDIYLNRANRVAAGVDWSDAVLTGAVPP